MAKAKKKPASKSFKILAQFGSSSKNRVEMKIEVEQENDQFDKISTVGRGIQMEFWAFHDTIKPGAGGNTPVYAAVYLPIPAIFVGIFPVGGASKYVKKGMFLVQPKDSAFLGAPGGDHGKHGCPVKIGGDGAEVVSSKKKKSPRKVRDITSFEFNKNYFHPLILPNWQTLYHVTEQKDAWDNYNGCCYNISVDFPIQYDTTLGIYYTREVSFLPKKEYSEDCEKEQNVDCTTLVRQQKLRELLEDIIPGFDMKQAENFFSVIK